MLIEELKLRDFRNYGELTLRPHPGINLFFGQNGSGKTNLLEAVHYCALGRSHRTSQDREVVRKGAASAACGVTLTRGGVRMDIAVRLTPAEARRKQVYVNRKRAPRLSNLMGHLQCVIFSPEDLMLVKEGPALRRRYLDMMLSQLSTPYFTALQQYQKALEQRSAILRDMKRGARGDSALLDAFEDAMARQCAVIIPMRRRMTERVARYAAERYASISGRPGERFAMAYESCLQGDADLAETARAALKSARREDILRGGCGFGAHREDLALTLSGREMKLFASQGQIRTAALCMKLAQLSVFQEESGENPILLLDDVMSELDMTRRTRLLEELSGVQTFVTCTDESDLQGCRNRRSYRVSASAAGYASIEETSEGEAVDSLGEESEEPDFS